MAYNFTAIEKKWQQYWLENKTFAALDPAEAGDMPKTYVLDMFPYPSGAGLHVGHPEGYTATDIVSPLSAHAAGTTCCTRWAGTRSACPPSSTPSRPTRTRADTTEENIKNFRRQIQMLGLSYDWDREVDTTDPEYYNWTQWIFLQLFNSYFDPIDQKAMPIGHLINELVNENLVVAPDGSDRTSTRRRRGWRRSPARCASSGSGASCRREEQREVIDGQRLAYMDEVPVNWCPGLGTVLANEEVIDGKSEVGGFPVERRPMRQWMLRITAYADRLAERSGPAATGPSR